MPASKRRRPAPFRDHWDVLILGAGLAGSSLARQLLLATDKHVLVLDRRAVPGPRQKVGEATVQMSGYYYARVLEMEEHLLQEHYLKYNLRFYWPSGAGAARYEDLSQSYLRLLSNIATYQLDRNKFEAELVRVNSAHPRCEVHAPIAGIDVELADEDSGEPHTFCFERDGREVRGTADWVVDATGRARLLAKRLGLTAKSPIRHGASFCWVEGLVDIEKLTDRSAREVRLRPDRSALGHLPTFLATNHFCGEGYWFWTIPLHGITSLGLVYDAEKIPRADVATPEKMIDWVCRRYPMFARDLKRRKIVDQGGFVDFAFDCQRTLSTARWALTGEACRFTDPLYSPGGDLISLYNTLITDAITTPRADLAAKVPRYEALARSIYEAYVPSYAVSYDTLGDQEAFTLRYVWELSVYFAFYVFPFVNDLFTHPAFAPGFFRRFARLGPINRNLHVFLADYYRWKRDHLAPVPGPPVHFDFSEVPALRRAESCFYQIGVSPSAAHRVLDEQLSHLEELARWIVAHVSSSVLSDARALVHPEFVAAIDPATARFDPGDMAARLAACGPAAAPYRWSFDPTVACRLAPLREACDEAQAPAER